MDQQTIIESIEKRAKASGLSISALCEAAGVHPTTFSRWKLSDRNADPVGASLKSLSALESALGRLTSTMSTRIPLIRATAMPADTNPYGGIFGGWLMSQMALAAGSLASRTAKGKCVVVAATDMSFPGAPALGDEISVYAEIVKQGRTSLTIRAEAEGRERDGERLYDVAAGTFTFVALDETDKPRPVAG